MLSDFIKNVKSWAGERRSDLITAAFIFLTGMAGFGLGRLSVLWVSKQPITIEEDGGFETREKTNSPSTNQEASILESAKGQFVASKSGTSYHYPWCPGAQKIKEQNKIWFQSKEDAESGGYKPAGNCPGL